MPTRSLEPQPTRSRLARALAAAAAAVAMTALGATSAAAAPTRGDTITLPAPPESGSYEVRSSSVHCVARIMLGWSPTIWVDCYNIGGGGRSYSASVHCSDGNSYSSGPVAYGSTAVAACPGGTSMRAFSITAL